MCSVWIDRYYTHPDEQGIKEVGAPLLHRHVVEHTIEIRTRHHDRMEPMRSSSAAIEKVGC